MTMRYILLTALVSISCITDAASQGRNRERAGKLTEFTFKTVDFPSPSVGGESSYGIYLPKDYDDEKNAKRRYPWAIWLHGMRGNSGRFRNGGSATFDKMRKAGKIPDMILVTPSASSRPTYIDRGRGRNEESMILKDLMEHVAKSYRVSKERRHRAIMGVSMGAFGAMKMALKYPKLFGTVAVHSSPVLTADPSELGRYRRFATQIFGDPIDKKEWAKEIPVALLATMETKTLKGLRIYFDAGTDDRYGFSLSNIALSQQMKKAKIAHTFKSIKGGGHSWGTSSIQHAMQFSFPFVAESFKAERVAEPKLQEPKKAGK